MTLTLNLFILLLVAIAVADPRFALPQRLVVVVDNQTPPAAAEAGGIEAVKALARGIIDAKAPEDAMLVIAAAEPLVVPSGWTHDQQELLTAVDAIVERPGPADREAWHPLPRSRRATTISIKCAGSAPTPRAVSSAVGTPTASPPATGCAA